MKLYKPKHRNARVAQLHVGAQRPVQHPLCDLDDPTRPDLYPDDRAIGPVLAAFMPKTTAVIWMPAIMKLYHLPDMGRMTLRWLLVASRGYSPAPTAAANAPPTSIPSSSPPSSTISIPRPARKRTSLQSSH